MRVSGRNYAFPRLVKVHKSSSHHFFQIYIVGIKTDFSREDKPVEQKVEEALVSVGDEEGLKKTIGDDELESTDEEEEEEEQKDLGRFLRMHFAGVAVKFSGESTRTSGRP